MSEATVVIKSSTVYKEGTGAKGPWRLWHIVDGNDEKYSTFNSAQGELAQNLVGKRATLTFEVNEKGYKDLKELAGPLDDKPEEKLGTGEYVKGQTAPVDVRGIAASVALKAAVDSYAIMEGAGKNGAALIKSIEATANEYMRWLLSQRDGTYGQADGENLPF